MRMNLTARSLTSTYPSGSDRSVSLTLRPACAVPGDFSYVTDCPSLLRMLRQKTELRAAVLKQFEEELTVATSARLFSVELSERTLTEIGYFVE